MFMCKKLRKHFILVLIILLIPLLSSVIVFAQDSDDSPSTQDVLKSEGLKSVDPTKVVQPQPISNFFARGIDVSKWNGTINWRAVADSGIQFAMIRTSFGWSNWEKFTDRQLINNINGAKSVGIPIGAYHYSYAKNPQQAIMEADFFINRLKWTRWEYPACLDIEDDSQLELNVQQRTDVAITFLERVKSAGYYVGIYANLNWTRYKLDMDRLSPYQLWIAHWNNKCGCTRPYGIWQYTNSGSVPGIETQVDLNYSYKDYPSIIKSAHLNGF
ncbi:MAG: hypothetical protein RUMPE_00470 [Eubacteriales bacterium SKADARSKE-1]|nr:hypothetical protein [Eubacteriales bacterium SKADARSKE-1]